MSKKSKADAFARERPGYFQVDGQVAERANRQDWDRYADDYQAEHGEFLGDVRFLWCPEGLDEADAHLLGDVEGQRVLEIGSGASQCARWLRTQGATAVAFDLSHRQLQHSRRIDDSSGVQVPVAQASVSALPFADESFEVAFSAFGAMSFVIDLQGAMSEVARVLRPAGRFVSSIVHPTRWMFPDDPTRNGLRVTRSYFDRTPYVESASNGHPSYVEPHHTIGDWLGALTASAMVLESWIEPEWPPGHDRVWGGWGPERGALGPRDGDHRGAIGGLESRLGAGEVRLVRIIVAGGGPATVVVARATASAEHHEQADPDQQQGRGSSRREAPTPGPP